MKNPINIIIAEDELMFLNVIVEHLSPLNIITIADAANGEELLVLLETIKPDVVLLDLRMPVMDGNEAMLHIASRFPEIKVIILSFHADNLLIDNFILKGAKGYVPKGCSMTILEEAIRKVHAGETFFVKETLVEKREVSYTPKQVEVIAHLSDGLSNKEIAAEINISERCVEKHKQQIYAKNKMERGFDFYKYAFEKGFQFLKWRKK